MKVVIFGLTISSSWANEHATLWRGLCRALALRGHKIVFFERDVPPHAAHRDLVHWLDGELWLYPDFKNIRYQVRRHLADADVAIITSSCPDALSASTLLLDSPVAMKVFYDLDTAVTLSGTLPVGPSVDIGPRGLQDFDLVLSGNGGRALEELQQRLGARRVAALYGGVDPEQYFRVSPEERFHSDLSCLVAHAGGTHDALDELFLAPASLRPDRHFLLGGAPDPLRCAQPDNVFLVSFDGAPQHPAFYSSSRLTLNLTPRALKERGFCPSAQLFAAAACGAPIVSDSWAGLDLFFTPGSEILVANARHDVLAALDISDAELAAIAGRARERVLDEHTVAHRALHLESILDNAANAAAETELAAWRDAEPATAQRGAGRAELAARARGHEKGPVAGPARETIAKTN